jgi:hypothetical protein
MRISPAPRAQVPRPSGVIPTEALDRQLKMAVALRIGQAHNVTSMQVLSSSYEAPGANNAGTFSATVQGPNGAVYTVKGQYELGQDPRVYATEIGGLGPA